MPSIPRTPRRGKSGPLGPLEHLAALLGIDTDKLRRRLQHDPLGVAIDTPTWRLGDLLAAAAVLGVTIPAAWIEEVRHGT